MASHHLTFPCRICQAAILPSTSQRIGGLRLDCAYSEGRRIAQEARASAPGCAACDGSIRTEVYSFDWGRACRGEGDDCKYPKYLRYERAVKHGARYTCTVCAATWFLDQKARNGRMIRIAARYLAAFDTWCETRLICPPSILDAAHAIGATPPGVDGITREAWIPCRAITRQGERIDPAMLRFSDEAPISRIDDPPERMNFAPVPVIGPRGTRFILNGRTDFFNHDGVAGSDLRLAWHSAGARLVSDSPSPVTVFAADWFDGAEALYIPAPAPADWLWQWFHWRWVRLGL